MARPAPVTVPDELTDWESRIYEALVADARAGRRASTAEQLQIACGCNSLSTTSHLIQRLERRGMITVERYQRARRITIVATGQSTATPINPSPHWRVRPRPASMPTPTLGRLMERRGGHLDFAKDVLSAARAERMELGDFLAELAWAGWQQREASIQDLASGD